MNSQIDQIKASLTTICSVGMEIENTEFRFEIDHHINLLSNQLNILERLQLNLGNAIFDTCNDEINEVIELAAGCASLTQKVSLKETDNNETDKIEFSLSKYRESAIKLNLLQQRIAAKVMKIKSPAQN